MPAEVETMAYAARGGVPWHGLGVSVTERLTTAEMIAAAGLAWNVRTVEMRTVEGDDIPDKRAVIREGELPVGAARVLGVVGKGYEPAPNVEIMGFIDSLITDGIVDWETMISLRGGRIVTGLARLGEDWTVGDDVHKTYVAVTAGHDGGLAIAAMPTDVRIVCMNTHRMAFGERAQNATVSIRHTRNVKEQMQEAAKLMRITTASQRRYQEWCEKLLAEKVESAAVQDVIKFIFGDPEEAESVRKLNNIESATNAFKSRFLAQEIAREGQNAYALLQAFTGYADHGMRYIGDDNKKAEQRFASTVIRGRSLDFKNRASVAVAQLAGVQLA